MYVLPIYDEERHRVTGYCEVTEEVYRAYWQEVEHARWLEKQARSREISWQGVPDMPDEDTLSFHAAQKPPDPESAAQGAALREALAAEPPELVEAPLGAGEWGNHLRRNCSEMGSKQENCMGKNRSRPRAPARKTFKKK